MKIGIIEIMPKGHFTLVNSLIQIYTSDPTNEIYVFTHKTGYEILNPIIVKSQNIFVICKPENQNISDFIKSLNKYDFNKCYVVTLDKYFSKISLIKRTIPLYLFVHNNENWFSLSFYILLYRFFAIISKTKNIIYSTKVCFIYPIYKRKIKKQVINSNGKFVVLNKILMQELSNYTKEESIEIIPFSLYDPSIVGFGEHNKLLRVCIPGILDDSRRDYYSVFNCILNNIDFFRNKIEIELLGGNEIKDNNIIREAEKIIKMGVNILYHPISFIPFQEYDKALAKADIILGNFYTVINKYSIYGKTKDTGVVFAMIRVAKPGILPLDYNLIDELHSSTLRYSTYNDLTEILKKLILDKDLLAHLKVEAKKNSMFFLPQNIYQSL